MRPSNAKALRCEVIKGQAAEMAQTRGAWPAGPPAQQRAEQTDGLAARAAGAVGGGQAFVLAGTADASGPGVAGGGRPGARRGKRLNVIGALLFSGGLALAE